jgi:hypothetical protein
LYHQIAKGQQGKDLFKKYKFNLFNAIKSKYILYVLGQEELTKNSEQWTTYCIT